MKMIQIMKEVKKQINRVKKVKMDRQKLIVIKTTKIEN